MVEERALGVVAMFVVYVHSKEGADILSHTWAGRQVIARRDGK